MTELLFKIGEGVVLLNIFTLLIFVRWGSKEASVLWALTCLALFNCLMQFCGEYLKNRYTSFEPDVFRHIWYLFFVFIDLLAVFFLAIMHRSYEVRASKLAIFVAFNFLILSAINTLRYITYVLFGLDLEFVKGIYIFGIPYVNICVAITALFVTIRKVKGTRSL